MQDAKKKPWFPVKRFGYGVGFPIAWEGWLVLGIYVAVVALSAAFFAERSPIIFGLVMLVASAALLMVARSRTDREWKWRDGK